MIERARSSYGTLIQRKRVLRSVIFVLIAVFAVVAISFFLYFWRDQGGGEKSRALNLWDDASYEEVFHLSEDNLTRTPLSSFWLVMRGFSSYQLATAQITTHDTLTYIDESIKNLRKALLVGAGKTEGRVCYVLGKAYYQKGPQYADEAVLFLKKASDLSYKASDIDEYLGLSYAALHNYQESVVAFSQALGENPSDLLLLAIARSYIALDENDSARAYLVRCAENSKDTNIIVQAKLLLSKVLLSLGQGEDAEQELLSIIAVDDNNAEAHFSLGELYAAMGDSVKARAEWRKAVRIDPTHGPARARLSL